MASRATQIPAPQVLVLDDDPEMAALLGMIARRSGFRTAVTTDFDEFRRYHTRGPEIVILDLVMPEIDGVEVIRYLAARKSNAAVLLVSGVHSRVLAAASRLASAQGLSVLGALPKPLVPQQVADVLAGNAELARDRTRHPSVLITCEDLRRGLTAGEFTVHFQPKIDVQTLRFVSVEALARWEHPEHGIINPHTFIDLAEQANLITELTDAVIVEAFRHSAAWSEEGLNLNMSVNISTRCLGDLGLPERLDAMTKEYRIDPARTVLEITESWVGQDTVAALDILTRLRMRGFDLSIDDFGTGYSTMLKLKQIPFSELKLDQSFIRDAAADAESRTIVESSIDLGQKLGLHVVAEGIERQEDWDLISELGCDEGQGYFIARPMAGEDVPGWLGHWNRSLGIV